MSRAREADQDAGRRYIADTINHELVILSDEGLYRHLRIHERGSSFYWFDVVTWPRHLVITGDMGTYVFSREDDMFGWFGYDRKNINPTYWEEKLRADDTGHAVKEFDHGVFVETIRQHIADALLDDRERAAVLAHAEETLLADDLEAATSDEAARDAIHDWRGPHGFEFHDTWEYDFTAYRYQYLWCCHAILDAIRRYRAAKPVELDAAATT